MRPAPILLAGGASSRLGQPKALADLAGQSVLERMLVQLAEAQTMERSIDAEAPNLPLIVTGAHHAEITRHLAGPTWSVDFIQNRDWASGRTSSVQTAVRNRTGQSLLLWPVDVPLVPSTVLRRLILEWRSLGGPPQGWLAPAVQMERPGPKPGTGMGTETQSSTPVRFGHPVIIGASLAHDALELAPDQPLRALRALASPLASVDVAAREVLDDLDTPEDLGDLRARFQNG